MYVRVRVVFGEGAGAVLAAHLAGGLHDHKDVAQPFVFARGDEAVAAVHTRLPRYHSFDAGEVIVLGQRLGKQVVLGLQRGFAQHVGRQRRNGKQHVVFIEPGGDERNVARGGVRFAVVEPHGVGEQRVGAAERRRFFVHPVYEFADVPVHHVVRERVAGVVGGADERGGKELAGREYVAAFEPQHRAGDIAVLPYVFGKQRLARDRVFESFFVYVVDQVERDHRGDQLCRYRGRDFFAGRRVEQDLPGVDAAYDDHIAAGDLGRFYHLGRLRSFRAFVRKRGETARGEHYERGEYRRYSDDFFHFCSSFFVKERILRA